MTGQNGRFVPSHGQSRTTEYRVWKSIKNRCFNKNSIDYQTYGGSGISMCDEWSKSFECFRAYVGPRPSPRHSVDRIDNGRGYEPGNVRWATPIEQANNKRACNRHITFGDRTMTISQWARELAIGRDVIAARLDKHGWTIEQALTTPPRRSLVTWNGETHTMTGLARHLGIHVQTIRSRINRGAPPTG